MSGKGFEDLSSSGWSAERFTEDGTDEVSWTSKPRDATAKRPPSRFLGSLLALVLFPFTGIVALIMSFKVVSSWSAGSDRLSADYSQRARFWMITSLYLGVLTLASVFILTLVSAYSFQTL